MDEDQFNFFKGLVETTGPSGYEAEAQSLWRSRLEGVVDSMETDSLGNCMATLNNSGKPSVLLDAHIDEIGFIVRYIDDDGFVYFAAIGGFDPSTLPGNRVRIVGRRGPVLGVVGRKAVHLMEADDRKKAPDIKDLWIDVGARGREEAESLLAVGDAGGRANGLERMHGDFVTANSLDDRAGSYVIAEVMRAVANGGLRACVQAGSSTQEEIGLRGARVTAYHSNADIGIAVDVTSTADIPHGSKTDIGDLRVGAGPILARGPNTNPRVFERLVNAASSEGAPFQVEADATGTGTNQNVMYIARSGMATGLLSIPTRYLHSSSEVLCLADVDATVAVLSRFLRDLDETVDLTP
ncbi:MAG: M42 family peptidase [Chloroflexota bacterium]|nr:MAG: hypothetical protein DLM70_18260 [Chloroflexota bacterium]